MTQRIAIKSGMDWVDASVDFVNIPDGIEISDLHIEYKAYEDEQRQLATAWMKRNPNYTQNMPKDDPYPSRLSFSQWILENITGATESDIEEYWEY